MNLAGVIAAHPADDAALVSRGEVTTYGELREQVDTVRAVLVGLGIVPGDRVAIVAGNTRHFVVAYLALLGAGIVAVPLNPSDPPSALTAELVVVGAVAVVVDPVGASAWAGVELGAVPSLRHVVWAGDGAGPADAAAAAVDAVVADAPPPVGPIDIVLDAAPAGDRAAIVDVPAGHLAALLFTSGTAGAPRAAMLTHANLLANIEQSSRRDGAVARTDVALCVLPLFHVFGLNVLLGQALAAGASVVLVQRFDPTTALETIAQRSVTIVAGAPPMFVAWCALADAPADAFASVRLVTSGAAALGVDTAETFRDRFGLPVREGYGLTEASPVVTTSVGMQPRSGTVGRALPGVDLRVVDSSGDDVEDGDPGELLVKGPNVFAGYWADAAATERVLVNGWLRTGDVVVMDDDGYVSIVDRVKDLVIVSGFNVFPAEVEEVIAAFPGVAEVAVIGVPHPHTGEAVKAYVVAKDGAELYEEPIIQHCLEHLARYKCPSKVMIVPEVPRSDAGKLLRRVLR